MEQEINGQFIEHIPSKALCCPGGDGILNLSGLGELVVEWRGGGCSLESKDLEYLLLVSWDLG